MHTEHNLTTTPIGENVIISQITATGNLAKRLRDLGLVSGTKLEVLGRAPLGDPISVRLRGTVFALRKSEANQIIVEN